MEIEQQTLSEIVDDMFERSDRAAHKIMHQIAALACENVIQSNGRPVVFEPQCGRISGLAAREVLKRSDEAA